MYRQQPILPREDKSLNQKHAQILKKLTRIPENKDCADCKNKNVARWASVNLGVFICIRCSGIHRNMGVHISRVKSVDLDSWTPEQIETVRRWGNRRANIYWEAALQQGHKPAEDKMESFIRTKYERKRWAKDDEVPDPETLGPVSDFLSEDQQPSTPTTPASRISKPLPGVVKTSSDLLGEFDSGATSSAPPARQGQGPVQVPPKSTPAPVLKSSANSTNDSGGLISLDFSSSSTSPTSKQQQQRSSSTSTISDSNPKKNAHADIMSLFSSVPPKPNFSSPTSSNSNQLSTNFFAAPQPSSSAPPTSTGLIPDIFSSSSQQNTTSSTTSSSVFSAPKSGSALVSDFSGLNLSSSSSTSNINNNKNNNNFAASGLPSFNSSFTSSNNQQNHHQSTPSGSQTQSTMNPWSLNMNNTSTMNPNPTSAITTSSITSSPPRQGRPSIGGASDILGAGMNPWSSNTQNNPTSSLPPMPAKIVPSSVSSNVNNSASATGGDDTFGDWSSFEAAPPISNSAFGTSSFATSSANPTVNAADVFANVWNK